MIALYVTVLVVVFVALIVGLYQKNSNAICRSKKRLDGKIAIVTGGTSGMGLRIATDFAERGARVIVACPFVDEGTQGRKRIIDITGNEDVIFKLLDLSSIDSIRKFVADVNHTEKRLDILINNAGVGAIDDFVTNDGMSFIMQVNYFGHFLLTLLLLPLLRKAATSSEPARVVNTASVIYLIGMIDFDRLNHSNYWYSIQCYANSKLCLILFAHELAKKLQGANVVINCVDPGAVGTTIFNCAGKFSGRFLTFMANVLFKTPWEGAQTAIHVALDRRAGMVSGQLFKNCKQIKATSSAYDDKMSGRLWNESIKLVGLESDKVNQILAMSN